MKTPGFRTITLGCKLNRFDSAVIEAELRGRGLLPEDDLSAAGVVVINTCAVTGKADADGRRVIRRVRRANPSCKILVTGCYAGLDARAVELSAPVDRVFGNEDKARVGAILDELGIRAAAPARSGVDATRGECEVATPIFGDRGRAFLKVQEGCDLACSYCVIPRVRGPSRSVPPVQVESSFDALLAAGYREIVLTGVNTGDYGRDLSPRITLSRLLERLLRRCGPNRVRLNSLEPLAVTDEIIGIMAADPRLAPHVQVPLQSGSEPVLRLMRRNYRLSTYLDRVERLRDAVPHAAIGADVIVGFPEETDARFEETYRFVESSPLNYLHVFAWSARPGTPASSLPGRVAAPAVRERSARLRRLGDLLSHRFRRGFEGKTLDAVMLGGSPGGDGQRALTGNFIEVDVTRGRAEARSLVAVRVTRAEPERTLAVLAGRPRWASESPS